MPTMLVAGFERFGAISSIYLRAAAVTRTLFATQLPPINTHFV
jgi:hypothetical protein